MNTDAQQIRQEDFEYWLKDFSRKYSMDFFSGARLEYSEHSALRMNNAYWELREAVRQQMEDPECRINCFKVIAGVQSIILFDQPFESPIESGEIEIQKGIRRINAEFAFAVSINILFSFYEEEFSSFERIIREFMKSTDLISLREFHLDWSEKLNFPVSDSGDVSFHSYFLLAQFWQTLYYWLVEYIRSNKDR